MKVETATVIEEFRYPNVDYRGVGASCWFRVLASDNRPFVVICSQRGNEGLSICNIHEFFRKELAKTLKGKRRLQHVKLFSDNLREMDGWLKPLAVTLVDSYLRSRDKNDVPNRFADAGHIIWVEHWPASSVLSGVEEFWSVSWSGSYEHEPKFTKTTLQEITEQTGYSEDELRLRFGS